MSDMFKVGDVVRLKSGGPNMTVTAVGPDEQGTPQVWVSWFDEKKQAANGYYPAAAVEAM